MKKIITMFLAAALLLGSLTCLLPLGVAEAATADGVDAAKYTYEIIPLLEPFNDYFYVKTENPDPDSFRFIDRDSVYADADEPASIRQYEYAFSGDDLFADVVYEKPEIKRVKGGYIFESRNTDGGKVTLQTAVSYDYWGKGTEWKDADLTLTLPKLYDYIDYLINTYSKGSGFFDKMEAIQTGLESICLYSGSYIRGDLVREDSYWSVTRSPHIDQTYYIYSPYERKDTRYLLATALYPYRLDSLGFPSTMARVALRLDKAATYQWSSASHAFVDVTYKGETRTFGGQGNGKGQGLSEDKITKTFAFGGSNMGITLESLKKLQDQYAQVEMKDDIPRDDELTWKDITDTVGDGAWARLLNGFAYLYKKDSDDYYRAEEWGGVGHSLYWGGSLGYVKNAWIDGRYVGMWSMYEPGATFEEHPTDDVILTDITFPVFTYERQYTYDWETGTRKEEYKNVTVTEQTGLLRYSYNASENTWDVSGYPAYNAEDRTWSTSDYETAAALAQNGLIDKKYVDVLRLTYAQVLALDVDRNTDLHPDRGYNYSGTVKPGTPFDRSAINTGDLSVLFAEAKAIAEDNGLKFSLDEDYYGMCGDSMYWVYLQDSETLIITGTGDMATLGQSPWYPGKLPVSAKRLFIGEGVESLQDRAFLYCMVETVSLPTTLKKIGRQAFYGCDSLTHIEIPAGVTSIGSRAFDRCSAMTDIYCPAPSKPKGWSNDWLGNCEATVHWGEAMPEAMLGDVNMNGKIDATDYLLLKRHCLGSFVLTVPQKAVADINKDGKINSVDYLLVKRHVLGTFKIA